MLLTHDEIVSLVASGVVRGSREGAVNGASVDVHLSDHFLLEGRPDSQRMTIDVARRETPQFWETTVPPGHTIAMTPGQFALASTVESFFLPNDIAALFVMKSSVARCGLDQMNAAWCHPGWSGSTLTLELMNVLRSHTLKLTPGMAIGQMVFFRGTTVPQEALYSKRGTFNHQIGATPNSRKE